MNCWFIFLTKTFSIRIVSFSAHIRRCVAWPASALLDKIKRYFQANFFKKKFVFRIFSTKMYYEWILVYLFVSIFSDNWVWTAVYFLQATFTTKPFVSAKSFVSTWTLHAVTRIASDKSRIFPNKWRSSKGTHDGPKENMECYEATCCRV